MSKSDISPFIIESKSRLSPKAELKLFPASEPSSLVVSDTGFSSKHPLTLSTKPSAASSAIGVESVKPFA